MTYRTRAEDSAVSGDSSHFLKSGSCFFSQPSEIGHWCESVPFENFPPTPPDTASECANSDCLDMNPSWMSSMSEDAWILDPTMDQNTVQPMPAQDLSTMDTSSWFDTADGSVDLGLSPVLSSASQTAHSLYPFHESDVAVLPPNLDLSFVAEPAWSHNCPDGSALYYPMHPVGYISHQPTMSSRSPAENMQCAVSSRPEMPETHQPVYAPQSAHSTYPGGPQSSDSAAAPRRVLLPRTQAPSAVTSQQGHDPRMLRRQMPTSQVHQSPVAAVSSMPTQSTGVSANVPISSRGSASAPSMSSNSFPGPGQAVASGQSLVPRGRSTGTNIYLEPPTEDLGAYFHFDSADNNVSPRTTSYMTEYSGTADHFATPSTQDLDFKTAAASGDADEGRHRNHPLYSKGPDKDGMYRCPYQGQPSCQHQPTKLKCNYDKFIDSHIKPFRCKIESCSKQEFSSTACLLRHEREAHGMHGHGDRPHLCLYQGCERGQPGSGFPRRYNLYDHMRRVHGHPPAAPEKPNSSGAAEPKKPTGRKRKAASPTVASPAARRVKSVNVPQQRVLADAQPVFHSPPALHATTARYQSTAPMPLSETHHNQDLRYTQWERQRDLLAQKMNDVHSPADIARVSEELQELSRRYSEEFAPSEEHYRR